MTTTPPEPTDQDHMSDLSASETFQSFTKFDEIAVAKAFDADIYSLRQRPFDFLRCLVFTHQRRLGRSHEDAKKYAFECTIADLGSYFPRSEADQELDPEEPRTDEGKGDSLTA